MIRWHHWLSGHEFEQAPGQGSLVCCSLWGHKDSDTTEQLNNRRGLLSSVRWKVIDVFSAVWYLIFWKDHCNYCAKSKLEGASEGIWWEITQVRDKDGFEQWSREDNDWIWGEFWSQLIGFHARLNKRCERKELRMTPISWLCKPLEG